MPQVLLARRGRARTPGEQTLDTKPGSPQENGHIKSFIGKMRDKLPNGEMCDMVLQAKMLLERWGQDYNRLRAHGSLAYRAPALETIESMPPGAASGHCRSRRF